MEDIPVDMFIGNHCFRAAKTVNVVTHSKKEYYAGTPEGQGKGRKSF